MKDLQTELYRFRWPEVTKGCLWPEVLFSLRLIRGIPFICGLEVSYKEMHNRVSLSIIIYKRILKSII